MSNDTSRRHRTGEHHRISGVPDSYASGVADRPVVDARATFEARDNPTDMTFELGGVIFDQPAVPPALWGNGSQVLAALGEPTMIYSRPGIGKTTIAQRVALATIGIGDPNVLGFDVRQIAGNVLYLAEDRPRQALGSARRMVTEDNRERLDARWKWETKRLLRLDQNVPNRLYDLALQADAELVIIDSLKDVLPDLSREESGGAFNDAVQKCVANGVEVLTLHHARKAPSDGTTTMKLDDVYGSTWITAGQGSVIALQGKASAGVAKLRHLKTPADEVGPFDIEFNYNTGSVRTVGRRDVLEFLAEQGSVWSSTADVARYMTAKPKPSDADRKRVLRTLDSHYRADEVDRKLGAGNSAEWALASRT